VVAALFLTAGRLVLRPAGVLARSAGLDLPRRLEGAAVEAAANPAAERVIDGVLAGPLPELVGRALGEHRVVERVVAEVVTSTDLEQEVREALASPALERVLDEAVESRLGVELADRMIRSPEFERLLGQVLASPQVRRALTQQSTSLAEETADGLRRRAVGLDADAERVPRRWLRRPSRTAEGAGIPANVPYAGVATRGVALAVDAGLVLLAFLVGSALVGLVASLVGDLRPEWLVGVVAAASGLLLQLVYFVGFWTTTGQTPGMRLMRLRVVDGAGAPPGLARSLVRLVGLGLAIIPCFAGFLPVLVDDRRRGLQDFIAGTVVVYDTHVPRGSV
jgi:uncharacterized RDD family membrane protein YckC